MGKKETHGGSSNSRKAIWLRNKSEVKREEYDEFYKSLTDDSEPPSSRAALRRGGQNRVKVPAFIPTQKPFSFDWEEQVAGLRLYVQRVLIMDRCEQVLPFYLRLCAVGRFGSRPSNVSRESLEQNPLLDVIQKSVVKNVITKTINPLIH